MLLHNKFTAVAYVGEGQLLCSMEKWVKFLILQEGTERLICPIKEGKFWILIKQEQTKSIAVKFSTM